ncbi:MAG: hypothetical protein EZS28_023973 [Streblomastix strix]|uniref:Reverse transcriptase domain-containing protein n=1 Tax=Streblomastix strix TaxID=222440 RepID=A0A5J4VD69_9EUKA|nr:MAG: hypothetical protein EZS28_023973 [Streblomastix strix]
MLQSVIAEAMKRRSSRIFTYLDNILTLNQVPTILQLEIQQVMKILQELGWMIAMDKSNINPTQIEEFLGLLWSTRAMAMQRATSQRMGLLQLLNHLKKLAKRKKHVKTRESASVIGEIQYTRAQFKRGTLFVKQIQKLMDKVIDKRHWNKWTQLSKSAIPDITWWISKLAHNQPQCFTKINKPKVLGLLSQVSTVRISSIPQVHGIL